MAHARAATQLELAGRTQQTTGLLAQGLRGGGRLFDQGGVLLGHLVQLAHGLADLLDVVALLTGRGGDLADDVRHAAHAVHDFVHGLASLPHQGRTGLDPLHAGADQRLDFLGGIGRTLGQATHLAGHHGKATALLARTCGLHGRIERQDVGLERDAIDHASDVGDLA